MVDRYLAHCIIKLIILDETFYGDEEGNVGSANTVNELPKNIVLDTAECYVRDVINNLNLKRKQGRQDIWDDLISQVRKRSGR